MAHTGPTPLWFGKLFFISKKLFCFAKFLPLRFLFYLVFTTATFTTTHGFYKTNVYKMYISQYFHNHLCVFFPFLSICVWYGLISVLWTFSTSKLDFLKLWGVLIPKGFSKQSTLISWVGTSVDLCCTFALLLKIFLHK